MTDSCKTCIYINRLGGNAGQCRRYPPQVMYITDANGISEFTNERPYVDNNDYCGEYKGND